MINFGRAFPRSSGKNPKQQKRDDERVLRVQPSKTRKAVDMMSSAVVVDSGDLECLRSRTDSECSTDDSRHSHNDDDAFSCRTDQTTVRASNVRRVSVSGMGFDGEKHREKRAKTPMPDLVVLKRTQESHLLSLSRLRSFYRSQWTRTRKPQVCQTKRDFADYFFRFAALISSVFLSNSCTLLQMI